MNDFLETQQATFGLIIRKKHDMSESDQGTGTGTGTDMYSLLINGDHIFTPCASVISDYFKDAYTLKQLGLSVKTGTIVWNEHKPSLTNDSTETILLYNTNLTSTNEIKLTNFTNKTKFQYIKKEGTINPIIVVNRGHGNAKYVFKYALISDFKQPFLVENHLNVIYFDTNNTLTEDEKIQLYNKVIHSFQQPKTRQFISLYFGNNGLSKTELENVLPIYI
jgi:hypothetical protein